MPWMNRRTLATPLLDIGYLEAGDSDGPVAVLMHGFPYDAHACVEAGGLLAAEGWHVLAPWLRGFGPTTFRSSATMRSGEQAALGADLLAFLDALDVEQATLAGYDWGGRAACVVSAL
jgi:pimeloyl-ACP methyl ester carboxylesterase